MSQSLAHDPSFDHAAGAAGGGPSSWRRVAHWLRESLATATVIAALSGLAYWGYVNDWALPKFSELTGNAASTADEWCAEHDVPEADCIECQTGLVPPEKDYGWCKRHGVAQCPLEHADVVEMSDAPVVTAEDLAAADRALTTMPRSENNAHCKRYTRRIQFATAAAVEKAGVDIDVVVERPVIETVVANGEIAYDQTRLAHLASRADGVVWRVNKQVGDQVRQGELLLLVDSAEVGRLKEEFLQAVVQARLKQTNVDRLQPLALERLVPERQYREASAAQEDAHVRLQSARQKLVNLGLVVRDGDFAALAAEEISRRIQFLGVPAEVADRLDPETTSSNLLPVTSPLAGIVVQRDVVEGEVIDTAARLFSVSDVTRMWLLLDVRQEDMPQVALGQSVLFAAEGAGTAAEMRGTISWISTEAGDRTRTVKVRVDLPNSEGRLRANTFGQGRIVLREEPRATVAPSEALHWDGCCNVVFVRDRNYLKPDAPKFFHVRQVRPGVQMGERTEIIAGLMPGEVIASKNSVVLEAQLLKSNLGDGCGCGH